MTGRRRISGPGDRNARLELLEGWWDRDRVHEARVGVIGVGALGNEILKNLVLLDFRRVMVVDRDTVEQSNLSRSVLFRSRHDGMPKVDAARESLAELNPGMHVTTHHADVMHGIGLGHLRDLDIVIAGLDSRRVRWWLNRTVRALGVPWVEGATQGPHGHAMVFTPDDETPCYECGFTADDWRMINHVASCNALAVLAATQGRVATSPTAASMVAAAQVHQAMDLLHGRPVVAGRSMLFNLAQPDLMVSGRRRDPVCDGHFRYDPVMVTALRAASSTVADLLAVAAPRTGTPATVELRWDLVWQFDCTSCGSSTPVRRPAAVVDRSEAVCPHCQADREAQIIHRLTAPAHGQVRLAEVSIPDFDVVEVRGPEGSVWVELSGDRPGGPDLALDLGRDLDLRTVIPDADDVPVVI